MNKIHKVIWSKVRNCYVVVSELAKRVSRSSTVSRAGRASLAAVMAATALTIGTLAPSSAWAADSSITPTNAAYYAAIGDAVVGDNPFITNGNWGTDNGNKLDGVISTKESNNGRTISVKLGDGREYTYNYTTVTDANGTDHNYWIRDGFGVKAITERYHPDAKNLKLDLYIKGQANYDDIITTGEHTAAITDVKTAINNTALDEMAYIQYAAITNSASTEVANSFHYYIKQGEEYKDVGNNTAGAGLTNNFYIFKNNEFNSETGKYQFNGHDVEYGNIYQINGSIGVFLDKQVDGANSYSSSKALAQAHGVNVYGGTVYGLNNEVLVTGYNNKTGQWSTVWAAEVTDPNATIQSMTLDEFNEIMHHLHEEDVKLANADIVTTKVTNGKTNGISSTNNTAIPNGGSINLINKAGNQVPGLTVTYGGGTGGDDTFITITDTGINADDTASNAGSITLQTGSKVSAITSGSSTELTGLSINGTDYTISVPASAIDTDTHVKSGSYAVNVHNEVEMPLVDSTGTATGETVTITDVASTADITKLGNRITTNETNITNLGSRVTTNETNITNLGSRVTTNETNITHLGNKLTVVEGDTIKSGNINPSTGEITLVQKNNSTISVGNVSDYRVTNATYSGTTDNGTLSLIVTDTYTNAQNTVTVNGIASKDDISELNTKINNIDTSIQLASGDVIKSGKITEAGKIIIETQKGNEIELTGTLSDKNLTAVNYDETSGEMVFTVTDKYTGAAHQITEDGIASKTDISNLDTKITNNTTAITNLGDRVSVNETMINNHTSRLDAQRTYITDLGKRVSVNETNITNLGNRVSTNETNITTLQGDVTNLNSRVSVNETNITKLQGDVTNINTRLTVVEGDTIKDGDIDASGNITLTQKDGGTINVGTISDERLTAATYSDANDKGTLSLTVKDKYSNTQNTLTVDGIASKEDITTLQDHINNINTEIGLLDGEVITGGDITDQGKITMETNKGHTMTLDGTLSNDRLTKVDYDEAAGQMTFTVTDQFSDAKTTLTADGVASKTDISNLDTKITENKTNISNLTNRVDTAEINISKISQRVTNNETNITNIKGDINDLDTRITNNKTEINELDNRVTNNETKISNIDNRVTANTTNINKINGEITTIRSDISTLHTTIHAVDGNTIESGDIDASGNITLTQKDGGTIDVGTISDERLTAATYSDANDKGTLSLTVKDKYSHTQNTLTVDGIASKEDVTTLQAHIDNINTSISVLGGEALDGGNINNDGTITVHTNKGHKITLDGTLSDKSLTDVDYDKTTGNMTFTITDRFSNTTTPLTVEGIANKEDISALDARVTVNAGNITTLQKDVVKLDNRVTVNEGNITTLQGDVNALDARVTTNEANIALNTTNIAKNTTNIDILDNRVDANEININKLRTRVDIAETDINNLDNRVTTVEKDMIIGGDIDEATGKVTLTQSDGGVIDVGNICDSRLDNVSYDANAGKLTFTVSDHYNQDAPKTLEVDNIASKTDIATEATIRYEYDQAIINDYTNKTNYLDNRVSSLSNRVDKVGAGAAALAALHPLDFDPDDKLSFSAGVGNYAGATAAAIGAFYRPNERVMLSIGGTTGNGENMVNAGVSFALGKGGKVTTSRVAMAHEINDLRQQVAYLTAMVAQLSEFAGYQFNDLKPFPDTPDNHWAYEYVAKLAAEGIVEGYPSGSFNGERAMTRYEFAAMLYRALEKGFQLDARIIDEFEPELGRLSVERIRGEQNHKNKIERVRVNDSTPDRDNYGGKINVGKTW